jgi:hypothetical protein
MATAQSRAVVSQLAEAGIARPAMPLASSKAPCGRALRPAQPRSAASRRVAVRVQAVASPVKPTAPAKKGQAQISAEEAKELYRDMVLGRDFEDMCAQMYYRGKMFGFVHLYCGQEAVSSGARESDDWRIHHRLRPAPTLAHCPSHTMHRVCWICTDVSCADFTAIAPGNPTPSADRPPCRLPPPPPSPVQA